MSDLVADANIKNNTDVYGYILNGKDVETGGRQVIFDKIINLKFTRIDTKTGVESSFTLRSDWELEITRDNSYVFRKCLMKPHIRVEYQRVSDNTAIRIQIFVTNLHLQSAMQENGNKVWQSFSYNDNPIKYVTVQLGYFNQFPDFSDVTRGLTIDDYYELTGQRLTREYTEIKCMVLGIYPIRNPPDGETLFDCVVGDISKPYHSSQSETDLTVKFDESTTLEKYLFEMITRRFTKEYVEPSKLRLDVTAADRITTVDETGTKDVITRTGPMAVDTARKYGVQCYLSDLAKQQGFISDGEKPKVIPPITQRNDVTGAFFEIAKMLPHLRFVALPSGDYIIFHQSENATQVANYLVREGINTPVKGIPAIYSITYSGLRTIKCPFTSIVAPFQELSFTSRYNIGNLVGYFYSPKPGYERFIVINYKVNFSTTGEENEMELLSTDSDAAAGA